jgi:hypothetical protein
MIVSCSRITSGDQALQLPIMLSGHTRERLQGDLIPQANVLASVGRWHCQSVCMTWRFAHESQSYCFIRIYVTLTHRSETYSSVPAPISEEVGYVV